MNIFRKFVNFISGGRFFADEPPPEGEGGEYLKPPRMPGKDEIDVDDWDELEAKTGASVPDEVETDFIDEQDEQDIAEMGSADQPGTGGGAPDEYENEEISEAIEFIESIGLPFEAYEHTPVRILEIAEILARMPAVVFTPEIPADANLRSVDYIDSIDELILRAGDRAEYKTIVETSFGFALVEGNQSDPISFDEDDDLPDFHDDLPDFHDDNDAPF